jgi:hypothetical protein
MTRCTRRVMSFLVHAPCFVLLFPCYPAAFYSSRCVDIVKTAMMPARGEITQLSHVGEWDPDQYQVRVPSSLPPSFLPSLSLSRPPPPPLVPLHPPRPSLPPSLSNDSHLNPSKQPAP